MAADRKRTRHVGWRLLALVAAMSAGFGCVAGSALAYWTSSGSATGAGTTGTLAAPTSVTGTQTQGTGSVVVSWTSSSGSPSPTGYYVTRAGSSNTVVAACGSSAANPVPGPSCTDTAVPLGSYTYSVVAVYRSWTATSATSASVTVGQASQTINFTSSPVNPTFGGTYHVTATGGGSGNPVTFSSATPSVCTVNGSTVSFVHAGSCTIDADQAGSAYYAVAATVTQTFTVAKAAQTIVFTSLAPANATVGGASYTVAATGGGSGNPVTFSIDGVATSVCSISGTTVTYQHVGTCVVDANQAGTGDYLAANQVQQSIAVGQGAQAITFTSTAPSAAHVGGSYTVSATASSGLTVAITLGATSTGCSLSGSTVTFIGVGTCIIDANQSGNADYLAAGQVQQSFGITKTDQTIGFTSSAPTGAVVGGPTYTATATATSGLAVQFTSATPSVCTSGGTNGATFTFVAPGSCTVNADQAGDGTYNAAPRVQQTFTVTGPAVTAVTMSNVGRSNSAGRIESGDTLTITYSGQMDASTFCGSWTNSGTQTLNGNGQVVVTVTDNGARDSLSVTASGCSTFRFGTVNLGADYVGSTTTFSGSGGNASLISLTTAGVLTVTLGGANVAGSATGVAASQPTYTPVSGLRDSSGVALSTNPFTDPSASRF
jgi:hypothetical protein